MGLKDVRSPRDTLGLVESDLEIDTMLSVRVCRTFDVTIESDGAVRPL